MTPYERHHTRQTLAPVACYRWNTCLSEALYPVLASAEVAVRNTLYRAIATAYPIGPWSALPCWLDRDPPVLVASDQLRVAHAVRTLRQQGKPPEPGRVVAELTFGFWTSLLDVRYEHQQRFWPTLLGDAFPLLPRTARTRRTVSARLNRIRRLRNRVFHHEPIWHWQDLREQYEHTLDVLSWISPELTHLTVADSRFPTIHAAGWECYQSGVYG